MPRSLKACTRLAQRFGATPSGSLSNLTKELPHGSPAEYLYGCSDRSYRLAAWLFERPNVILKCAATAAPKQSAKAFKCAKCVGALKLGKRSLSSEAWPFRLASLTEKKFEPREQIKIEADLFGIGWLATTKSHRRRKGSWTPAPGSGIRPTYSRPLFYLLASISLANKYQTDNKKMTPQSSGRHMILLVSRKTVTNK